MSTTLRPPEFKFSDLSRSSKTVASAADHGPVRITRRDAQDLILLRAEVYEYQDQGIALASRIMRAVLASHGDMRAALTSVFAWTSVLSPGSLVEFATEIDSLLWSSTELGAYGRLQQELHNWKSTAQAIAEGHVNPGSYTWLGDAVAVERPVVG